MTEIKWTKEQLDVIKARDCNILVAAAAGSGKTAILTQRIIEILTDDAHPVDIDRILVLTDEGIVEEGNHDELMELGGIYHQFYMMANEIK